MTALVLFAIAAVLAFSSPSAAAEPPANFAIHESPRELPALAFQDGDGQRHGLADFHGRVVVLNIWATWCIPCRREMPSLDRLQAQLGTSDLAVVALSIDRAGPAAVRRFYDEVGIHNLPLYVDSSGRAARDLGIPGIPATILINREGRELGRLVGAAEWDSPEMIAFLRQQIEQHTGLDLGPPAVVAAAFPRPSGRQALPISAQRTEALRLRNRMRIP